jgi:hypothetical protein
MSPRQNGRISQLLPRRARSARARGLRTLQHQVLARLTLQAIDAEIWLRALIVERARTEGPAGALADPGWATKDQLHDEALAWFLQRYEHCPALPAQGAPPARRRGGAAARGVSQDVTFWVDSHLLARMRRLAVRHGVRPAQLIQRALEAFIAAHIPAEVRRFHQRAQAQALRLQRRRAGTDARLS